MQVGPAQDAGQVKEAVGSAAAGTGEVQSLEEIHMPVLSSGLYLLGTVLRKSAMP